MFKRTYGRPVTPEMVEEAIANEKDLHEARVKRAEERRARYEANRTDPDYWVRQAEGALKWGQPEKVPYYLALARYYRDGGEKP